MSIENPLENKNKQIRYEENPFEDEIVSREWISSVENEKDMARDKEIYPRLSKWIEEVDPNVVVEIGAGQGICSDKMNNHRAKYIGIEPAPLLVERSKELYKNENRDFMVGNAYNLPLPSECCDASFAVNVWFHLENIDQAARELARILKPGGKFMIITLDPNEYEDILKSYENIKEEGKKVVGKAITPVTPLTKNAMYKHTIEEINESLQQGGLNISSIEPFGTGGRKKNFFIQITGEKI